MTAGVPLRLISEIVARWKLANLKALVVEGQSDRRFVLGLQGEDFYTGSFSAIDVWHIGSLDVSEALLRRHGIIGDGAKWRVVAFGREMEGLAVQAGFRSIVDKDYDPFLGIDCRSAAVLYTDYCCLEAYAWTRRVLRRLLIAFRCEGPMASAHAVRKLYKSVGEVCKRLAAVRIARERNQGWDLKMHRSEKALSTDGMEITIDLAKYVSQMGYPKGKLVAIREGVAAIEGELDGIDHRELINSHDLVWVLTYVFRNLSGLPRHAISEELVVGVMISTGLGNSGLREEPMLKALEDWAAA